MQLIKQNLVRTIIERLTYLRAFIGLNTASGVTDFNRGAEDFFCTLLNKIYGYNLKNLNLEKSNFPAIDLGDDESKICFQITSDGSSEKIKETIFKFKRHNLAVRFNKLIVLIISPQRVSKAKQNIKDVTIESWDLNNLSHDIPSLDLNTLQSIEQIFANGLVSSIDKKPSILDGFNVTAPRIGKCDSFIASLEFECSDDAEKDALRNDLQKLSDIFSLLSKEERGFLYMALVLGKQAKNFRGNAAENKFYVPCITLDLQVKDGVDFFNALAHRNLMSFIDDYYPYGDSEAVASLSVHFYGKSETNYFIPLKNFLLSDITLRQFILTNDFGVLN